MNCELKGLCSGCPWLGVPYEEQLENKKQSLLQHLKELEIKIPDNLAMVSVAENGLRDRVDLTWERKQGQLRLGLFAQDRSGIVDMKACPALSPELEAWLKDFRKTPIPLVEKGSVRLRVSPTGERGLWLDLSHVDVKNLMDEGEWLHEQLKNGVVEIGQRFKPLGFNDERLKLDKKVHPRPWFETYLGDILTPRPLYGAIGSFTQPGFQANKALVKEVVDLSKNKSGAQTLELFSGLGNFTLPLASMGLEVNAYEVDPVSQWSFRETLNQVNDESLKRRIRFTKQDLYRQKGLPDLNKTDVLVVDPPRSGLKGVVDHILAASPGKRPAEIIYISCFQKSFAADMSRLQHEGGYRLTSLKGIDQFPQTPHGEWVGLLTT